MSLWMLVHPFRVQDATGQRVRFRRRIRSKSTRRMNRATAKFMAWRFLILSGPESMQSINRTRETVLLRNGYPPKTISRFMYTTAVLNVLVLPFAIFGGAS